MGDLSNISDPLSDNFFKSLDEIRVLDPIFKVIAAHLAPTGLALLSSGIDLWVVNEFDGWYYDILLALNKIDFELGQILLNAIEASRRAATLLSGNRFNLLI